MPPKAGKDTESSSPHFEWHLQIFNYIVLKVQTILAPNNAKNKLCFSLDCFSICIFSFVFTFYYTGLWFITVVYLCPVHIATFLYKSAHLNLRFCETVHSTPHKNAQTRVFTKTPFKVENFSFIMKIVKFCFQQALNQPQVIYLFIYFYLFIYYFEPSSKQQSALKNVKV